VNVQVSKILTKTEKMVNEQLEAEVLTQSSNSSNTSYVVAVDLSEMELKKILIDKIEGNKSIHRSDEQRNLYKALEKATRTTGKSTQRFKSRQTSASESATAKDPMQTTHDLEEPSHQEFKLGAADDQPIVEASQQPKCDGTLNDVRTALDDRLKLTNLTVEERFAFNVSLRMFVRSIVIQRRVEDLQLDVESYQKKPNLTRPDTYHSDMKRKEAYTAYSNP
nr:hypothetical protein [Tanacetum cinerariifolium]